MDRILEGTLDSNHPEELKNALFERIVQTASTIEDKNIICNILECCTKTILSNISHYHVTMTKRILNTFARVHCEVTGNFFAEKLGKLYESGFFKNDQNLSDKKMLFELLSHVLSIIGTAGGSGPTNDLMHQVISCFMEEDTVSTCAIIAEVSIRNWTRDAIKSRETELISKVISLLRLFTLKVDFGSVESPVLEITNRVYQANLISSFFSKIIALEEKFVHFALGEIFNVLSQEKVQSSITLTPLLTSIPPEYAEFAADTICSNSKVKDRNIELALCKLIDWLAWPGNKNLELWIITLCKKLVMDGKRNKLLADIIKKKSVVVFNHMFSQESRQSALSVFTYMMLVYQHSPDVFHKVAARIPSLFALIENISVDAANDVVLKTLSDLVYTLMYIYPGSSDIYSNLATTLKKYPKPTQADINRWLTRSCINEQGDTATQKCAEPPRKPINGKTGLTNLGNTCYMNSVIQALFMLKGFRSRLLSMTLTEESDPVTYNLAKLFAFLRLSERTAISPTDFYKISRPPWFRPGAQQDCSEFLKFLIERLEHEDKSRHAGEASSTKSKELPSGIHASFTGECRVDVKCLNCNSVSSRFEAFNDIPLAFPDTIEEGKRTFSLKGGDISRGRLNSRVKGNESLTGSESKDVLEANSVNPVTQSQSSIANPSQIERKKIGVTFEENRERPLRLQELLDSYLLAERLHGQNQYRCDNCASLQDAEQRHLFKLCPKFLVLTLKRFTYDIKTHQRGKIMRNVQFPYELTIPVLIGSEDDEKEEVSRGPADCLAMDFEESEGKDCYRCPVDSSADLACAAKPVLKIIGEENKVYSLVAVIIHSGVSSESGHYYCYCRRKSPFATSGVKRGQRSPKQCSNESAKAANDYVPIASKDKDVSVSGSREETADFQSSKERLEMTEATNDPKNDEKSEEENRWYLFNDSLVTAVNTSDLEKIQSDHPRDTPYVFIYEETCLEKMTSEEEQIKPDLSLLVESDNREYFKEHRNSKRSLYDTNWQSKTRKWDKDNDDGNGGGGSSGNCGGDFGGLNLNAGRFIY